MNELKETQDADDAKPQPHPKKQFGETGQRTMQGPEIEEKANEGSDNSQETPQSAIEQKELNRIQDVPVSQLPWPEGVNGPQDFEKISHQDAVHVTNELQKMKPLIEEGYGAEDFGQLDKANGVDYLTGQQRIFELFYGSDPIRVYKYGEQYSIDKGRHRVYVAKELGLETIPAQVREIDPPSTTLEKE